MNVATTSGPTPPAEEDTPILQWPDPSPLQHWWTEVMDGALTPAPASPTTRS
ncbi:hypothetical protein [Nocardia pseudobrasiliensis]|uniref:Uncharacterized protein n=1 Tax=Nocardia pseudobrasiliensis TaxID=45979 RepID=A0A370ID86_9NOCA|nr:hypothetical protein [Nocardia pseudobrasiliensis]RDI68091.1 hypothetical protein DFR76_102492 [Nocardia pseudobrasiliensis]